jgi:hypothetical protein
MTDPAIDGWMSGLPDESRVAHVVSPYPSPFPGIEIPSHLRGHALPIPRLKEGDMYMMFAPVEQKHIPEPEPEPPASSSPAPAARRGPFAQAFRAAERKHSPASSPPPPTPHTFTPAPSLRPTSPPPPPTSVSPLPYHISEAASSLSHKSGYVWCSSRDINNCCPSKCPSTQT